MRDIDLFAFASVSEGCRIVLIDTIAVHASIITSDIYPLNHIEKQRETVPLVDASDHEGYALAIIKLITNKQLLCNKRRADFKRWSEEFSKEKMSRLTDNLYQRLNESLSTNAPSRLE